VNTPAAVIVAATILLALGACSKQSTVENSEPSTAEESATPVPAEETTAEVSRTETATAEPLPTPRPNYFAPEGVYFLIGSISIETDEGIERINPGARLERQPDGSYTDSRGRTFKLRADEVTNDLRVAQRIAGADAANQAAIRQQLTAAAQSRRPASTAATKPGSSARPPQPGAAPAPAATAQENIVASTQGRSGGVQSSSTLGAGHTRVKNGIVWQKNADGEWVGIRYTNGKLIPAEVAPRER
jgi:hypothetical protein